MRPARLALLAAVALAILACDAANESTAQTRAPANDEERVFYAIGQGMANKFALKGIFTESELGLVNKGFNDAVMDQSEVKLEDYLERMNTLVTGRRAAGHQEMADASAEYIRQAALEAGAQVTESGLVYFELVAGTGASPGAESEVTVHYTGSFTDGEVFDSSVQRDEPITFPLDKVIPGWQEGLQMMKVGGKAKLVVPSDLAYGPGGKPPSIPPNVALVFEVELIAVK